MPHRPGYLEVDGSRVCLFDVEAELSSLHWAFFDEVGTSAARFLYLAGLRAAVALTATWNTRAVSTGFIEAGLALLEKRGYGSFRIQSSSKERWTVVIDADSTLEAWAYLRRQSQAASPVCNYTRGLLAGLACIAAEPAGNPAANMVCWETECVARGDRACRFVVGSAENLIAAGYTHTIEDVSPRWALEAVNARLKLSADQLREAETRLSERQQAYQHLLDNMLDPLLVINRERKLVFCNLRFLEVTGLTEQQAMGSNPLDFVHVDDRAGVTRMFESLLAGKVKSITHTFRAGTAHKQAVFESSARTITGPDGQSAIEAICRDVTDREKTRQTLESVNKQLTTKQRIADNDLRLAKMVHESLLPKPVSNRWIDIDVKYVPVDRVGGDYCHIATVDGRYVVLTLCDVSGHGVAAALLASRVNSHLSEQEMIDPDPWSITRDMDQFLRTNFGDTGMFVTFLAVTIDLKTLTARVCGAGHPGPIVWRKGTGDAASMPSQHLPIGILDEFQRSPHFATLSLEPGDRIVLYTDGIIDVVDKRGEPLRPSGMEKLIREAADVEFFSLGDWLFNQVAGERSKHDDMTLMLVEIKERMTLRSDYSVGTI